MRRMSLLTQGCVNLCDVARDGTLSSIIFWHLSLKNDIVEVALGGVALDNRL